MSEDTVQSSKDVDEVLDANILTVGVVQDDESAWKDLLVRYDIGCPVEGVAAVVNGATALGLFVNGTKELPLGGAHLGACTGAARRGVEEEADDKGVALGDEEAAELIKPYGSVDSGRRLGELEGCSAGQWLGASRSVVVVQRGEVFL